MVARIGGGISGSRRRRFVHVALASHVTLASVAAAGCGLQLAPGLRSDLDGSEQGTAEVGGRLHRVRHSSPYAGLDLTLAAPDDRLTLRSVTVATGYRWRVSAPLRIELGTELAMGEPATRSYGSTGLYLGGAGALLLRLPPWGTQHDNLLGIAPFGTAIDLVATGRGGRWTRAMADQGPGQWEAGVELGIRVTVFTDLLMASHDSWEGPWRGH